MLLHEGVQPLPLDYLEALGVDQGVQERVGDTVGGRLAHPGGLQADEGHGGLFSGKGARGEDYEKDEE